MSTAPPSSPPGDAEPGAAAPVAPPLAASAAARPAAGPAAAVHAMPERGRFAPVTPPAAKRILGIGLPIVGGMVSQNVLDLVDTIMVGRLGEAALAAVGIAAFANFMAVALLIGLAAGVQALTARRKGEGRLSEMAIPLNGGLAFAAAGGVVIALAGVILAPTLYPMLVDHNDAVVAEGVPYFTARVAGALAIALNFSFRGYWYGIGETGTYLKIIVSVHLVNVVLSYGLIFGVAGLPELGTLGAGLGTTIALYFGTVLYAVTTLRRARPHGFLERLPRGETMASLLRLSIPSAIQTLLFATGLTVLFVIAAQVGTTALAVSNILVNLSKLAVLPAMGMGLAAMSLVSEALGARDPERAERWAWQTVQLAAVVVFVVAAVLLAAPAAVLGVFTTDVGVVAAGVLPLRILATALMAEVLAAVMMNALTGAGAARSAMVVNVSTQWLLGLPLAYLLALPLEGGLTGMWLGYAAFRLASAAVLTALWLNGFWKTIKL